MSVSINLALDAKATLGEGALWDSKKGLLYWVDILGHELHIYNPLNNNDRTIHLGQYVTSVVPRSKGGLMLGVSSGYASLDPDTEELQLVAEIERDIPGNRPNDGKCDPAGRFWLGTMDIDARPKQGTLYCMDIHGRVQRMLEGVSISNGIVWSKDNATMYYIDTLTWELASYDYDISTGQISNRRVAVTFPREAGHPDGMTIDEEGMLWVAMCGGGSVSRWNPATGLLLDKIELPVSLVTSCAFGGPDLRDLYITSARVTLDDAALRREPHAGGLFCARPGVAGLPAYECAV